MTSKIGRWSLSSYSWGFLPTCGFQKKCGNSQLKSAQAFRKLVFLSWCFKNFTLQFCCLKNTQSFLYLKWVTVSFGGVSDPAERSFLCGESWQLVWSSWYIIKLCIVEDWGSLWRHFMKLVTNYMKMNPHVAKWVFSILSEHVFEQTDFIRDCEMALPPKQSKHDTCG